MKRQTHFSPFLAFLQVVSQHSYHVRPTTSDINENLLSEQCRTDYGLTEVSIKEALPLDAIVRQFDAELTSRGLEAASVCLVTDGQLAIRQSLFPEAQRKGISLPSYYYRFHDLRKEFSSAYPDSAASEVEDMLKCKNPFIIHVSLFPNVREVA